MKKITLSIFITFFTFVTIGQNKLDKKHVLSKQGSQVLAYYKLGGLIVQSKDGQHGVKVGFRLQPRLTVEKTIDPLIKPEVGFALRRGRIKANSWAFDKRFETKFEFDVVRPHVLDAVIKARIIKKNGHSLTLQVGQTKLPGNHEYLISSQKQQFADRSIVHSAFLLNRGIGTQLKAKLKAGKAIILPVFSWSLGDGKGVFRNSNGFQYTTRVSVLPLGQFKDPKGYSYFGDFKRNDKPRFALGAAYDINNGTTQQRGNNGKGTIVDIDTNVVRADMHTVFADVLLKYKGFSTFFQYAYRSVSNEALNSDKSVQANRIDKGFNTGNGYLIHAGYMIYTPKVKNVEFAARYATTVPNSSNSSLKRENEYTVAASKYFSGHNLKVQTDMSILQEIGKPLDYRWRLQMEFAF